MHVDILESLQDDAVSALQDPAVRSGRHAQGFPNLRGNLDGSVLADRYPQRAIASAGGEYALEPSRRTRH